MTPTVVVHGSVPEDLTLLLLHAGYDRAQVTPLFTTFVLSRHSTTTVATGSQGQNRAVADNKRVLYTPDEAAKQLGIGRTKVFELLASGRLHSVRIGKSRRIPAWALVDLVCHLDGTIEDQAGHDRSSSLDSDPLGYCKEDTW